MDLESYTTIYAQTHPTPALHRLSPLTDWRFWLLVLVVGGGILVSGIRTQAAFLDSAPAGPATTAQVGALLYTLAPQLARRILTPPHPVEAGITRPHHVD